MCQRSGVHCCYLVCRRNLPRKYLECSGLACTSPLFAHIFTSSSPLLPTLKTAQNPAFSEHTVWLRALHIGLLLARSRLATLCLFRLNWKRSQQLFRCRSYEIFIFELMHTAQYIGSAKPIPSFAIYFMRWTGALQTHRRKQTLSNLKICWQYSVLSYCIKFGGGGGGGDDDGAAAVAIAAIAFDLFFSLCSSFFVCHLFFFWFLLFCSTVLCSQCVPVNWMTHISCLQCVYLLLASINFGM